MHANPPTIHRPPTLIISISLIEPRSLSLIDSTSRCVTVDVLVHKKSHFTRMCNPHEASRTPDIDLLRRRPHSRKDIRRTHSKTRGRMCICENGLASSSVRYGSVATQLTSCGCTLRCVRSCSDNSHILSNPQSQPFEVALEVPDPPHCLGTPQREQQPCRRRMSHSCSPDK